MRVGGPSLRRGVLQGPPQRLTCPSVFRLTAPRPRLAYHCESQLTFGSISMINPSVEVATLGGGCFWCLEAVYDQLQGGDRRRVRVTPAATSRAPSYEQVCGGRTGHAEVVQVTFDPAVITFRQILEVFFTIHDPTTLNRQGADVGPQYRSAIFYHSPEQKATAEQVIADLTRKSYGTGGSSRRSRRSTRSTPRRSTTRSTFARNPGQGYCQFIIAPKVAKFRKEHLARSQTLNRGAASASSRKGRGRNRHEGLGHRRRGLHRQRHCRRAPRGGALGHGLRQPGHRPPGSAVPERRGVLPG